jgi:hypothetical protein
MARSDALPFLSLSAGRSTGNFKGVRVLWNCCSIQNGIGVRLESRCTDCDGICKDLTRTRLTKRKGLSGALRSLLFTDDYLPLPKTALFGLMPCYLHYRIFPGSLTVVKNKKTSKRIHLIWRRLRGFVATSIPACCPPGLYLRGCRLPATARLSAPSGMPETGLARFIQLAACFLRAAYRPLSHALLAVVEHSLAPFPYGWADARGPDPRLRRVAMPGHRPGSIGEERLQTERRFPNRV